MRSGKQLCDNGLMQHEAEYNTIAGCPMQQIEISGPPVLEASLTLECTCKGFRRLHIHFHMLLEQILENVPAKCAIVEKAISSARNDQ
jgi:hypothetical protein